VRNAKEVDAGRFRGDLYYRINVVQVRVPRLRERKEDIPVLAEFFRSQYMKQFGRPSELLTPKMLVYLQSLSWPGNVRELSNGIARYVIVGADAAVTEGFDWNQPTKRAGSQRERAVLPLKRVAKEAVRELEKKVIAEALRANQWNRRKTASALKISYRALIYKIRNTGLDNA
jgi:DNA-binding NtrC family response regulator